MINKILCQFDRKTFNSCFILIQEATVENDKALFVRWFSLVQMLTSY